jgi:hypothetical protein
VLAALTACVPAPAGPPAADVPPAAWPTADVPPGPAADPHAVGGGEEKTPAQILDLGSWKLTLPVAGAPGVDRGNPWEAAQVSQPQLAGFSLAPYFAPTGDGTGVVFAAPVGGVTTPGSAFARSELREMSGPGVPAAWSSTSGMHAMALYEAITHLPVARPELVAGQIHGRNGYVLLVRLRGTRLFVEHAGRDVGDLTRDYQLGTPFTIRMVAGGGQVRVYYNESVRVTIPLRESGLYFKAGVYPQSNPGMGDAPGAYGETVLYDLRVAHR